MEYVGIGQAKDFPENTCRVVSLPGGEPVLVVNLEGEIHALEGSCSGGHSLEDAIVVAEEGKVLCPTHGWEFDVERGVCLAEPDRVFRKLPVRVENNEVQIGRE